MNLKELFEGSSGLTETNRPIRLRLSQQQRALDDVLLVKRVTGNETLCGGLEYRQATRPCPPNQPTAN
jgi:type VI secretion system secreted protein VgrG